jgi:hypothetical protein
VACLNETLRALLGLRALLWVNECYGVFCPPDATIPPQLDLISVRRIRMD